MAEPLLITIDLRFRSSEDPEQMAERVREAVRMIAGRDHQKEDAWQGLIGERVGNDGERADDAVGCGDYTRGTEERMVS